MSLQDLLASRTAPFREMNVDAFLRRELDSAQIPHFHDRVGNLIAGVAGEREYVRALRGPVPARLYIAHMDHPGFHGVEGSERNFQLEWHGGTPVAHLEGAEIWVRSTALADWEGRGWVREPVLAPSGRTMVRSRLELESNLPAGAGASTLYGAFRFQKPVWEEAGCLRGSVCDDLVGCYAIVETLKQAYRRGKLRAGFAPVIGLLSRAEEVGFIGTIAHLELGWLGRAKLRPLVVSLETSRAITPGAEIGRGPVVRLGDRFTAFSNGPTRALTELAEKLLPGAHQRKLMDGGTCEGSAATVYGHDVIALSVPLGNYHNQSFEGGSGARGALGPAPEFVHLGDVAGLLTLTAGIARRSFAWSNPWRKTRLEYRQSLRRYRAHLGPTRSSNAPLSAPQPQKESGS